MGEISIIKYLIQSIFFQMYRLCIWRDAAVISCISDKYSFTVYFNHLCMFAIFGIVIIAKCFYFFFMKREFMRTNKINHFYVIIIVMKYCKPPMKVKYIFDDIFCTPCLIP